MDPGNSKKNSLCRSVIPQGKEQSEDHTSVEKKGFNESTGTSGTNRTWSEAAILGLESLTSQP